jgi:predicted NUDIX family NTP pyrophosphohydrolase
MRKQSAGLLLYREKGDSVEVFLVHPGGPFWAKKDDGAWSIPKGEFDANEDPLDAAKREFQEETSFVASGKFLPLTPIRQRGGKIVHAWAVRADADAAKIKSNTFSIEWPPRSGKMREFAEVDRAAWFAIGWAKQKILKSQLPLLEQIEKLPVPPGEETLDA